MKAIKFYVFIILALAGLFSCEDVVENVKIPESKEKLVVQCFISPQDTVISVWVSMSVPIYNSNQNPFEGRLLPDAIVTISCDGAFAAIPYNHDASNYQLPASTFPIVAGKEYHLTVTRGSKEVSADCIVPVEPNTSLVVNSVDTAVGEYKDQIWYNVSFTDRVGTRDYYRLAGWKESVYSYCWDSIFWQHDTVIEELYIDNGTLFFSDRQTDGGSFRVKLTGYFDVFNESEISGKKTHICLLTTDRGYYLYHTSVMNFQGDNPFQEPSLVYTNVVDGLGVFAGYNQYSIELDY
ncbi:MAG: DUF4249 domain-containing protein [Bacteroidetes bacterium]|nr:DUF4249 domain-containing protein [Bacteroidota bacterium]MBU1720468.1 DUF4249 domain-containing protein [Bacteroidota bacterium]